MFYYCHPCTLWATCCCQTHTHTHNSMKAFAVTPCILLDSFCTVKSPVWFCRVLVAPELTGSCRLFGPQACLLSAGCRSSWPTCWRRTAGAAASRPHCTAASPGSGIWTALSTLSSTPLSTSNFAKPSSRSCTARPGWWEMSAVKIQKNK